MSIAPGYPLRLKQEDIGINGWAVEARVYAEVTKLHTYLQLHILIHTLFACFHIIFHKYLGPSEVPPFNWIPVHLH